jgi:bifunctional enzyme CysN/CysC
VKQSPLRILASGDGSGVSTLVARLRETSERLSIAAAHDASPRELFEGLAQSDATLLVFDAAKGSRERLAKELALASLSGAEPVVLAVLALATVSNAQAAFDSIEAEARRGGEGLELFAVPVAADHDVRARGGFDWYRGPTLAELFLDVESTSERLRKRPFRLSVARVTPEAGSEGTVASGELHQGDRVRIQGQASRVARIVKDDRDVDAATTGDAVTLFFDGALALTPGDLVSTAERPAEVADQFEATIVWLDTTPLLRGRNYVFELGGARRTATIGSLKRKSVPSGSLGSAPQKFENGEIGVCNLRLDRPIAFDPQRENRRTGGFRLIDAAGATVGFGALHFALRRAQNVHWQAIDVNKRARSLAKGQTPCVLWYTGLSGAGKSTIANLVDKKLHAMGRHTYLLDGDNVRHGLNKDLGFTAADRVENIRRIAEVAKLMVDAGLIVGTAFISPFRAERSMARALVGEGEFIEVFVDTPLGVAEERDPKGLYKKARRGELKNFTGIDSPYEAPEKPDLRIDTTSLTPEAAADLVVSFLGERGVVDAE